MFKSLASYIAISSPITALVLAPLYYSTLFEHFDGFSLSFLTISDYFDRAAEFIWSVFLWNIIGVSIYILWFFSDTLPDIIDGTNTLESSKKKFWRIFEVIMLSLFALGAWIRETEHVLAYVPFLLITLALEFVLFLRKTYGWWKERSKLLWVSGAVAGTVFFTSNTFVKAHRDAIQIRHSATKDIITVVDVVSAGIIKVDGKELIFESADYGVLATAQIIPVENRSPACIVFKLHFLCNQKQRN